jgi:Holliday junction resolvase
MSKMQRDKGARFERELVHLFAAAWAPGTWRR